MSERSRISVRIVDGPLRPAAECDALSTPAAVGAAGAVVRFEGLVRCDEAGRAIRALRYDVYEPMASRQLHALATEITASQGLLALVAEHSRGAVAVGECSFRLTIEAAHRKEALAAMDEFIDRMKKDVPIWKTPMPAAGPIEAQRGI